MIEHMFDTRADKPAENRPHGGDIPDLWGYDHSESSLAAWEGKKGARTHAVPEGIEEWEPGVHLAAFLMGIDRTRISGYDLVRVMMAQSRLVSHFQSDLYETMGEITTLPHIGGPDTSASEIGAALKLTRSASEIEDELGRALRLHPEVLAALRSGDIDLRRARVIMSNIAELDLEVGQAVLKKVLPEAPDKTTGQLGARIRRLTIAAAPKQAAVTYQAALKDRKIVVYANPDGTASLLASNLPPDRINAIRAKLEELARAAKTPDDIRTADQLRADTFLDLLEGQVTGGRGRAFVNIDVDLTTLLGADDNPGHIPGWGPVTAEMARKIVSDQPDCDWEFTALDQGKPVATGTLARRPNTGMKRRIRSRYRTCVHPGCRRPARQSDLDHTRDWAKGGKTSLDNLAPLCEHHHQLKDQGWSYRILDAGTFRFTSPLGHTYITSGQSP